VFGAITAIPAIVCGILGARRAAKRGMAITGLVLGVLMLLGWIAGGVGAVIYVNRDENATSGSAAASTFDVTIDECKLTATGLATVTGTLANRTKKAKSFEVVVTLSDKATETERRTRVMLSDVPAKGVEQYQTEPEEFPRSARAITCRVIEVRNAP
jgi:hypothetical protein